MMKNKILMGFFLLSFIVLVYVGPTFAGPGGFIVKTAAKSFWGKLVLGILAIVFLPLIIYILGREWLAKRRTMRDLSFMAGYDPVFEWFKAKERVIECFHRIHGAWREEDVSEASGYMTDWYWRNQQLVYLDRWKREGLYNECDVKKIISVNPLLFLHRNDGAEHEGSILVVSVNAKMKDCLIERATGKMVEGDKKFRDHETIWSFTLNQGKWLVSNIEEDTLSMEYAAQIKYLPRIEDTLFEEAQTRRG